MSRNQRLIVTRQQTELRARSRRGGSLNGRRRQAAREWPGNLLRPEDAGDRKHEEPDQDEKDGETHHKNVAPGRAAEPAVIAGGCLGSVDRPRRRAAATGGDIGAMTDSEVRGVTWDSDGTSCHGSWRTAKDSSLQGPRGRDTILTQAIGFLLPFSGTVPA
jgi:hypothetical protein